MATAQEILRRYTANKIKAKSLSSLEDELDTLGALFARHGLFFERANTDGDNYWTFSLRSVHPETLAIRFHLRDVPTIHLEWSRIVNGYARDEEGEVDPTVQVIVNIDTGKWTSADGGVLIDYLAQIIEKVLGQRS